MEDDGLSLDDKHERWQRTYRLSPFAVGDSIALRPAPIQVRAAAMEMTFSWNRSASIRVTTEVVQRAGVEDLRPPTGIGSLPPLRVPRPKLAAGVDSKQCCGAGNYGGVDTAAAKGCIARP